MGPRDNALAHSVHNTCWWPEKKTHFFQVPRVSAARGRSSPSLRQWHIVYTGYTLVCVRRCRALSLLRAAVLLRPVSEDSEMKNPSNRRSSCRITTVCGTFWWLEKKLRCTRPIKPVFAPAARCVHRLQLGLHAAFSRALPTSLGSSSPWRIRGVVVAALKSVETTFILQVYYRLRHFLETRKNHSL